MKKIFNMDKIINSLVENRNAARGRVEDIVNRLGVDMTRDQVIGTMTTMLMLAEFKGNTDPLTKTANRGSFDKVTKELADNKSSKFSLIIFDIDHFKDFNDKFGHTTGDEVLVHVANKVKSTLRQNDFLARYGGEEFCVILPGDNMDDLRSVSEKIRESVESMSGFSSGHVDVPGVTVSVGAGVYDHDKPFKEFFDEVDKKLYESKKNGRNRSSILDKHV